jgi:radical SAM superfamily enzyme YgiQ (UPF0313 family)
MHKIGFLQPNFQSGPKHLNAFYLPYTVGILWSYAKQDPVIAENYSVKRWVFRRDPADEVVADLAECAVVFFSLYVWNRRYCFEVARRLKELNPNLITVFGGPELPHRDPNIFTKYPFIDTIVVGEGEQVVQEILLKHHNNEPIDQVLHAARIRDLDIPSPYLTGLFDDLMAQHPEIEWMPTLETDRGCPYKCTFCDWGGLTASKVVKFGLERVFDELEWFADKKLPFLTMTNANFGIFRERDMLIAEKIVELSKTAGYPTGISVSYAKNSNADIFEIVRKFQSANIQTGFILSLQTTTTSVLENIKRTNMNINDISSIADFGRKLQMPIFTEVIMGLPGETLETWKQNLENILNANLHNGIDTFFLNMIENAPMMGDIEKYDIKTFSANDMFYETSDEMSYESSTLERVEVIKSNNTLTEEQMLEVLLYTWQLIGFHIYGISDIIAIYLKKSQGISYREFYDKLNDYLANDDNITKWKQSIIAGYKQWSKTGMFIVKSDNLTLLSWQMSNSLSLLMHNADLVNHYISKVKSFVVDNFDIDAIIVDDYEILAKNRIKQWGKYLHDPATISVSTNLFDYVQNQADSVVVEKQQYLVQDRFKHFPAALSQHIDNIIYGRRRTWVLNKVDKI